MGAAEGLSAPNAASLAGIALVFTWAAFAVWLARRERGSRAGMRALLLVTRVLGRRGERREAAADAAARKQPGGSRQDIASGNRSIVGLVSAHAELL